MVRIIAPACPRCGSHDVEIQEMHALFEDKRKLDPIDINLAHWVVGFICWGCREPFAKDINDVKAPLGQVNWLEETCRQVRAEVAEKIEDGIKAPIGGPAV